MMGMRPSDETDLDLQGEPLLYPEEEERKFRPPSLRIG
jgi:hypothetical protein